MSSADTRITERPIKGSNSCPWIPCQCIKTHWYGQVIFCSLHYKDVNTRDATLLNCEIYHNKSKISKNLTWFSTQFYQACMQTILDRSRLLAVYGGNRDDTKCQQWHTKGVSLLALHYTVTVILHASRLSKEESTQSNWTHTMTAVMRNWEVLRKKSSVKHSMP